MRQIVKMLKKLGRNCHDFILHCRKSPAVTKEDKESALEIFLRIVSFLADAVQLLRKAEDDLSESVYSSGAVPNFQSYHFSIRKLILPCQSGNLQHGLN